MEIEDQINDALEVIDFVAFNKFLVENIDTRFDSGKTTEDEIGDIFEISAMANVEGIIGHDAEREKYISEAAGKVVSLNDEAEKVTGKGFLKEKITKGDSTMEERCVKAVHTIIRYYKEMLGDNSGQ